MSESNPALRFGIAASVAVHVALLCAGLGYAGFLFAPTVPEQSIAVDLVTPQELADVAKPPEAEVTTAAGDVPPTSAAPTSPAAMAPQPLAPQDVVKPDTPPQQPTAPQSEPDQPGPPSQQVAPQPKIANTDPQSQPVFTAPEPDLSVKYPMNLSLFGRMPGDFDAKAARAADLDTSAIAAFRMQLKDCSTMPAGVSLDDKVVIVIRAQFTPDGRLATAPILIEASASTKGPLLMQAAIAALQMCQPYASLPPDKYQEWKLLDLSFTPQDFKRG